MLQNRFGDTEFPIRDRWSSAGLYRRARLEAKGGLSRKRTPWWTVPVVAVIALLVTTPSLGQDSTGLRVGAWIGIGALVAALVGLLALSTSRDRRRPRLEQQQYWQLTGAVPLNERQQQLLAMDAQSDYAFGGWNSSLEYAPAWSKMPNPAQERHRRDPRWHPFFTMQPLEIDQLRARLDRDWHIASATDLELFVQDALTGRNLTTSFTVALAGSDSDRRLARLASLTGQNEWDLRALIATDPDQGTGLWAADTQRTISVIRMGYVAGYLDAAAAWRLIEQTATPAITRFNSWQSYWDNVRTGLAYASDRLETLQQFDTSLTELRHSSWPAATTPFPTLRESPQ